jgi:CRISP-associated protein Cas1
MTKNALKNKQIITITNDSESTTTLQLQNENLLIIKDKQTKSIPLSRILTVIVFGNITLTSPLIQTLLKNEASLVLSTNQGKHITTISPQNHSLNLKTYQLTQSSIEIAQLIVTDKIQAQLKLLQKRKLITSYQAQFTSISDKISFSSTTSSLLGIEGSFAQSYYQELFQHHKWQGRTPRTKKDPLNVLLDLGYMRLYYLFESLVSLSGFDPYVGFLHTHYYNRKSLVCDLMEAYRPQVDDILLTILNRKQVDLDDFIFDGAKWLFINPKTFYKYSTLFLKPLSTNLIEYYEYICKYADFINQKHK